MALVRSKEGGGGAVTRATGELQESYRSRKVDWGLGLACADRAHPGRVDWWRLEAGGTEGEVLFLSFRCVVRGTGEWLGALCSFREGVGLAIFIGERGHGCA